MHVLEVEDENRGCPPSGVQGQNPGSGVEAEALVAFGDSMDTAHLLFFSKIWQLSQSNFAVVFAEKEV